jgi:hypothetical protein
VRTDKTLQTLVAVLAPYIGETMAHAAVAAHAARLGLVGKAVAAGQLEVLLARLGAGLNVFVGPSTSAVALKDARRAVAALEDAP